MTLFHISFAKHIACRWKYFTVVYTKPQVKCGN